jgi:hypothetical protein
MIKFFQKIRQNMINDNKVSKYLLYAIGEIMLVVIGILIALQINNNNEIQKNKVTESKYIEEMLEDFEINLQSSEKALSALYRGLPALIELLKQSTLETPTVSIDSINNMFSFMQTMPFYSSTDRVYNNIMGSGDLKLITSTEVKTSLSDYYKALNVINIVQSTHEMILAQIIQPYIIENLDFQAVFYKRIDEFQLPPSTEEHRIMDVLMDRKFRNIIVTKLAILEDLLEQNYIRKNLIRIWSTF